LKPSNTYNKPCFEIAYLGENSINLLKQKVAIILGYFILSKNHNEPPNVAQLAKNRPIWSPGLWATQKVKALQSLFCVQVRNIEPA